MFKFLNIKREIFGADINDLSLKIVKLQKKGSGFNFISFNEVDIAPGIVKDGVIQDEKELIKIVNFACSTVKGKKLDTKYVVVSLPEEKSFAQVIQMPKMSEEELKSAVPFEAENYIPLPVDKVYLDFQVIDYHESNYTHLDLLINVMQKPIIDSYVSCFKGAGLIPCILEAESQAIVRALTKYGKKSSPAIFIDFGETKTSLIIHAENSVRFTVTMSISSSQLTSAISESLKIGLDESEKLKIQYGLEKKAGKKAYDLDSAIRPILYNLVEQIRKYLNFYHGHTSHEYFPSGRSVEKIILCGGGANLKNMPEFLSKELSVPVELGDPFINLINNKNGLFPHERTLSFTTAIGSALRGADDTYLNSYSDNI